MEGCLRGRSSETHARSRTIKLISGPTSGWTGLTILQSYLSTRPKCPRKWRANFKDVRNPSRRETESNKETDCAKRTIDTAGTMKDRPLHRAMISRSLIGHRTHAPLARLHFPEHAQTRLSIFKRRLRGTMMGPLTWPDRFMPRRSQRRVTNDRIRRDMIVISHIPACRVRRIPYLHREREIGSDAHGRRTTIKHSGLTSRNNAVPMSDSTLRRRSS
jgi:hypothetical protein